jgi:hypothetical protein
MDNKVEAWFRARPFATIMAALFACVVILNIYNRWIN